MCINLWICNFFAQWWFSIFFVNSTMWIKYFYARLRKTACAATKVKLDFFFHYMNEFTLSRIIEHATIRR